MKYIERDVQTEFLALCEEFPIVLVTGARQTGKSTMLRHFLKSPREEITLDDLQERDLARNDPELFLQSHHPPIMIDEVQYAPELFSYLKIWADGNPRKTGDIWLTGSQAFSLMRLAGESLAGRVGLLHLLPLSQHEMYGSGHLTAIEPDIDGLRKRLRTREPAATPEVYERIFKGSMPGVFNGQHPDPGRFYRTYQQTYIERDVRYMEERADILAFSRFMGAVAAQVGQLTNLQSLAQDVDIPRRKAEQWLGILQQSDLVFLLQPYSNNALSRAVKTPKIYFNDTGLAAWLGRWSSPETLEAGAMAGALLENYAVSQIRKNMNNTNDHGQLWFYRDRSGREVDLVIERDGRLIPIEIKRTANPSTSMTKSFKTLDAGPLKRDAGILLCMKSDAGMLPDGSIYFPIWGL